MTIIKNFSLNLILRRRANLQFAIGMLLFIGILIAIGTLIEQDQSIVFYQTNYPESQPIFGFVDWRFIYFLSLNKIYTSYWFASILFVFASSLIACTFTTQLPLLKKFKLLGLLNFGWSDQLLIYIAILFSVKKSVIG
jgi:hypothetical protein